MKIVIFGLTITSAWGNGHATTFRSLVKALSSKGHRIVFIEKDAEWYRSNRDLAKPAFCKLMLYDEWDAARNDLLRECADAEAIVLGSYFPDAIPATEALLAAGYGPLLFYDIDTPITLAGLRARGGTEYLQASLIPSYDAYLSFTGGPVLRELEVRFGAQRAYAFYCSVDPDLYKPSPLRAEYRCDLSYLGTYAADRQPKLLRLLREPARLLPQNEFLLAGAMYPETAWPRNVRQLTHVGPPDHPAFYSSARFTLNLTRQDMVEAGYSPSVRLFEASACGAAILSDDWEGLEEFLSPGEQILLPRDEHDVTDIVLQLSEAERTRIGRNARERVLASHTSLHRAEEFEEIVGGLKSSVRRQPLAGPAEADRQRTGDRDPGSSPATAPASTPLSPLR